ncbi:MAG: 50S ribosomal protein L17 [Bacteroidia bacterium]|nr:50S ribosomal protein L17 [Bacteroidia bacterium]MDW8332685.1 50S ribosomal protein L17 [Bacteroidia bacterium]
MRHRVTDNHLGRKVNHRASLLANLSNALLLHKRIRTTLAKAKALRKYVEPLITKSKTDTVHSRRTVFSYLRNKYAVKELFTKIAPEILDRPGGYTRILKLGPRQGDAAEMALIELVDFNEFYDAKSRAAKQRSAKPRRRKKKKAAPKNDAAGPTT